MNSITNWVAFSTALQSTSKGRKDCSLKVEMSIGSSTQMLTNTP